MRRPGFSPATIQGPSSGSYLISFEAHARELSLPWSENKRARIPHSIDAALTVVCRKRHLDMYFFFDLVSIASYELPASSILSIVLLDSCELKATSLCKFCLTIRNQWK